MATTMTAPPAGAERRAGGIRRQPTLGTVCRLNLSPKPGTGLVWNISLGGVSMLYHDRIDRGATITGVLATANDGFALPVTLRVAHVAPLQTGDYLIGGQFAAPLSHDEMRHFLPDGTRGH
jgi:hypothetical protein